MRQSSAKRRYLVSMCTADLSRLCVVGITIWINTVPWGTPDRTSTSSDFSPSYDNSLFHPCHNFPDQSMDVTCYAWEPAEPLSHKRQLRSGHINRLKQCFFKVRVATQRRVVGHYLVVREVSRT